MILTKLICGRECGACHREALTGNCDGESVVVRNMSSEGTRCCVVSLGDGEGVWDGLVWIVGETPGLLCKLPRICPGYRAVVTPSLWPPVEVFRYFVLRCLLRTSTTPWCGGRSIGHRFSCC